MTVRLSTEAVNTGVEAIAALLDDGWLRIFAAPQPANADTAPSSVLLAELRFDNPAVDVSAVDGLVTFNTLLEDSSANAGGTAAWFRAYRSDGTQVVLDGSIGTADADLIMNALGIALGGRVVCL